MKWLCDFMKNRVLYTFPGIEYPVLFLTILSGLFTKKHKIILPRSLLKATTVEPLQILIFSMENIDIFVLFGYNKKGGDSDGINQVLLFKIIHYSP